MEKCDSCGKTTLMPEVLGEAIICKKCLLKINGLFWKYRHISTIDGLEKNRAKALDLAKKNNFPDKVINGIEKYFDKQKNSFSVCEACGNPVLEIKKLGLTKLCKKCYEIIDLPELKSNKYFDKKELEKGREKVLNVAEKNNFPTKVVNYINDTFDKKCIGGWLYTINGGCGQILKVYEKYLIITTNSSFDEEEIAMEYQKLIKGKSSNDFVGMGSLLLGELTHFKNPLKGKNMMKMVTNIASNKLLSNTNKSKLNIKKGDWKLEYRVYDYIGSRMPKTEEEKGVIVIRNSKSLDIEASDAFFFFNNSNSIIKKLNIALPIIEENMIKVQTEKYQQNGINQSNSTSVSDQLRELKQLLDDGIITEADFENKKKQLLNL